MADRKSWGTRSWPEGEEMAPEDACPDCGERRVDEIKVADDGSVLCLNCRCRYQLAEVSE